MVKGAWGLGLVIAAGTKPRKVILYVEGTVSLQILCSMVGNLWWEVGGRRRRGGGKAQEGGG